MMPVVNIVGGGIAGSECALYLASRGVKVKLFEMRPERMTPAHQTGLLSELVCSNSLKSDMIENASGLLKSELTLLKSPLLDIAYQCRVKAGKALAVDREMFSRKITRTLEEKIEIIRKEITDIEELLTNQEYVVVATGPLTSSAFMTSLLKYFGSEELFFFDAVSPIINSEEIDREVVFSADRYNQFDNNNNPIPGAYLNCPMDKNSYESFREALIKAEVLPIKDFERKFLFERCQPIEEIARSGVDAMRFGPLKPVGLVNPRTRDKPYAVVQLRKEQKNDSMYNLVGFQTRLKWPEQKKIIRMIPGLQQVEILRYGVMHKNAYLNSPVLLHDNFSSKKNSKLFFAGQITGVEGYVESIASGHFVGLNLYRKLMDLDEVSFPRETMLGGLFYYCTHAEDLKPMYANFGLIPALSQRVQKKKRRVEKALRGLKFMKNFIEGEKIGVE